MQFQRAMCRVYAYIISANELLTESEFMLDCLNLVFNKPSADCVNKTFGKKTGNFEKMVKRGKLIIYYGIN
jgi:hypothetical protein